MKHTLAAYQGAIMKRVFAPRALDIAHVNQEINNAAQEVYLQVRTSHSDKLTTSATMQLVADKDMYQLPQGCEPGMVRGIDRMDRGSNPVALQPIPWERQNHYTGGLNVGSTHYGLWSGYTYTIEPGGTQVRILEKPSTNVDNGLRFWFIRKWAEMVNLEDIPVLPDAIHECVIPPAVIRMAQSPDARLANPAAFELYRQQMAAMLVRYLEPDEIDRPNVVQDYDRFYAFGE